MATAPKMTTVAVSRFNMTISSTSVFYTTARAQISAHVERVEKGRQPREHSAFRAWIDIRLAKNLVLREPRLHSPAVARAVHQLTCGSAARPLPLMPEGGDFEPATGRGASGASKSSFTDTGGTRVAPDQPPTTLTRRAPSSRALGLNL